MYYVKKKKKNNTTVYTINVYKYLIYIEWFNYRENYNYHGKKHFGEWCNPFSCCLTSCISIY